MGTKSPSCPLSAEADRVVVTRAPLDLESAVRQVADASKGAVVTFSGCVRGREGNAPIGSITYEVYAGMAEKELAKIVQAAESRWKGKVAVHHRFGRIAVGAASLIVASAAAHRREAFEACEFAVDRIKKDVPVWKTGFEWRSEA